MNLLGKAMDKAFWTEVREKDCYRKHREELMKLWEEKCVRREITTLRYSDFRLFKFTGNRSEYERAYFARRLAMDASALLALIFPEEEKYLVRLQDEIFAICDEYTWCLPAHQTALEVNNNCHIDLFASETGFALAEIYTMLGDRLEPLILDRIRVEIDRRVIDPYREQRATYWWTVGKNNWAAVCMGSVGCTVMLMHPEYVAELKPRFDATMACYLGSFRDDGICEEGFGYWHYGFGFFVVYADMIRTFTEGACDYFRDPKVREISAFVQKVYLTEEGTTVSFSDGGANGAYNLGLNHYLHHEYPDYVKTPDVKLSYHYDNCGRFCLHLRSFTWLDEAYLTPDPIVSEEYYAPDTQWMVKKTAAYGFAAKGGTNAESHNHNDIGSFIFAKGRRELLADIGGGPYTRQYFAADTRYTHVACSSRGHCLPIIDGALQGTGGAYRATDARFDPETDVFSLDIATAYDREALGLTALRRSFAFRDDAVELTDVYEIEDGHTIVERFVSYEVLTPGEPGVFTTEGGVFTYDPAVAGTPVLSEEKNGTRTVHILDLPLLPGAKKFTLHMA